MRLLHNSLPAFRVTKDQYSLHYYEGNTILNIPSIYFVKKKILDNRFSRIKITTRSLSDAVKLQSREELDGKIS